MTKNRLLTYSTASKMIKGIKGEYEKLYDQA